jgi:LysM repeat protein
MSIAAVTSPRVMGRPTVNGKNPMNRQSLFVVLTPWIFGGILVFQGCAHQAQTSTAPSIPPPTYSNSTLAIEAKAEAESFRAALASERIKTAKQAAVVRSTQQEAAALKARELEHAEKISQLKTELATITSERDQLRVEVTQLRAKTASAPQVLQLVTQMRTIETSLNNLSSSLGTLSKDIVTLRDEVEQQKLVATIKPTVSSKRQMKAEDRMVGTDLIVVQRGDSLWQLARTYGTSVNELKQINGLTHHTIVAGQFLKIPSMHDLDPEELAEIPNKKDDPTP